MFNDSNKSASACFGGREVRRVRSWELFKESWEEQRAAGRYNPGQKIAYVRKDGTRIEFPISAGRDDDVELYRQGKIDYVLSMNSRLGYAGIEAFLEGELIGEVFAQTDHEVESVLGKRAFDLMPATIASRLVRHLPEEAR